MLFVGMGKEEDEALVALLSGWGLTGAQAVALADALWRITLMPVHDAEAFGGEGRGPFATAAGRKAFADGGVEAIVAARGMTPVGGPGDDAGYNGYVVVRA